MRDDERNDDRVREFYSASGSRMREVDLWTDPIRDYLSCEEAEFGRYLDEAGPYQHVIEIGCCHGRYRGWAIERGLQYDGVDLVIPAGLHGHCLPESPGLRSKLHEGSVEQVSDILSGEGILNDPARRIAIMPFNCFGNLARVPVALRSLAVVNAPIFISTFRTTNPVTRQRERYYATCGYTELRVTTDDPLGVLVTSKEGLHSYAYFEPVLKRLLAESGFEIAFSTDVGIIGRAVVAEYRGSSPSGRGMP